MGISQIFIQREWKWLLREIFHWKTTRWASKYLQKENFREDFSSHTIFSFFRDLVKIGCTFGFAVACGVWKIRKLRKNIKKSQFSSVCYNNIFFVCLQKKNRNEKNWIAFNILTATSWKRGKIKWIFLWIKGAQIVVFNKKEEKCPQDNCRRKRIKF